MQALKKTTFGGRLVYLGRVAHGRTNLRDEALEQADLTFDGIDGECHGGATRPACSRVSDQHRRGTEIRNVRQLSVLSAEELAQVAREIGLTQLDPRLLGASMVIEGIPDFTRIPPSSRLQFDSGATITVDMENRPCVLPGREIEADHPGHGKAFKTAAQGRRGITAWVERPGLVALGDAVTLHVPDQPAWRHLETVRA